MTGMSTRPGRRAAAPPAPPPRRRFGGRVARTAVPVAALVAGLVVVAVMLTVPAGGRAAVQRPHPAPPRTASAPAPAVDTTGLSPVGPYQQAAVVAARDGLRVWLEADLVARWQAGPAQFEAGVQRLAAMSRLPGVVGFKIADELGYQDGMTSPARILAFLKDSRAALNRAAPGRKILIDMFVPELGCLPGLVPARLWPTVAAARERGKYPQLALGQVDRYVRSGGFDVLDVSTGLQQERTYTGWGTDRDTAQQLAWREIRRRGWPSLVTVQARKAMAAPEGGTGDLARAEADLRTWVDLPTEDGATAVDVWTWAQHYEGRVYALLGADLAVNPLWQGLAARRAQGLVLFTHFTPSTTRQDVPTDLARLATVFTDVFLATGTG
jgi:hypothetical protein